MKKKKLFQIGAAMALTVLFGGQRAEAQSKTQSETVTKRTGPGPNIEVKTETVTGKITRYEAGKKIEIEGPEGRNYNFELDESARIEGTIALGEMATVQHTKDQDGRERVVVLAAGAKAPKGGEPSPHAEHGQSHAAATSAQGATMHSETTTKRTGRGPNVKTKTEVVVGTVKEYEAGKKITVVGPEEKDYSFDLDEQVSLKGPITVGQRIRIEYTKSDDGAERVVVLSPKIAKSRKKKS